MTAHVRGSASRVLTVRRGRAPSPAPGREFAATEAGSAARGGPGPTDGVCPAGWDLAAVRLAETRNEGGQSQGSEGEGRLRSQCRPRTRRATVSIYSDFTGTSNASESNVNAEAAVFSLEAS